MSRQRSGSNQWLSRSGSTKTLTKSFSICYFCDTFSSSIKSPHSAPSECGQTEAWRHSMPPWIVYQSKNLWLKPIRKGQKAADERMLTWVFFSRAGWVLDMENEKLISSFSSVSQQKDNPLVSGSILEEDKHSRNYVWSMPLIGFSTHATQLSSAVLALGTRVLLSITKEYLLNMGRVVIPRRRETSLSF